MTPDREFELQNTFNKILSVHGAREARDYLIGEIRIVETDIANLRRVLPPLNVQGTVTGRLSSKDGPNYSNLPRPQSGTCPHNECVGVVDVPGGTFDGSALLCWGCDKESFLVINSDGSWSLDSGADADE